LAVRSKRFKEAARRLGADQESESDIFCARRDGSREAVTGAEATKEAISAMGAVVRLEAGIMVAMLSSVAVWFAMAIPTSLIAHRLGKSRWVPFLVWCPVVTLAMGVASVPFIRSIPLAAMPIVVDIISWGPGALYFWYLALSKPRQIAAAPVFE
jgi:hypothetical protein